MSKKGDIFEIAVAEGIVAFAQALNEPEYAFFSENPIEAQGQMPLFRIWVHNSAPKKWKKLGTAQPSEAFDIEIPRFKKDPITGALSTYVGGNESPATLEEVQNMECAAVWEEPHIIDRLADHLSGRQNQWLESLKP
jgi:hypothetical protein